MNTFLQLPLLGEPVVIAIIVLWLIIAGLVGRWVYRDAKHRGSDLAWQWGVGIAVLFAAGLVPCLLGLILYVLLRDDTPPTEDMTS